jgi:tetratricopeptide (TPR) repeat protein
MYEFRHLYKPLGYLSNIWGSMLIGFTGISILTLIFSLRKKTKSIFLFFLFILLTWNIIISFSRGVYISFAILLFSSLIFIIFYPVNRIKKSFLFITVILLPLVFGLIYKQDVVKTLQFNKSLSQQRSIYGRLDNMSSSLELFKKSPVIGTGAGTYSQVINNYRYEDDNNSFTNFAPNGYTQLLTDQGIIGFILWGALFIITIITALKKRKYSSIPIITLIITCIILIRETSFPALLTNSGFQLLFFTVLAVFQNILSYDETHKKIKYFQYLPVCIFCVTVLICSYSIYYAIDEQNNRKALSTIRIGELEKAKTYIAKTTERTPYLINRSIVEMALYKETKNTLYLNNSENQLKKAALKNPEDNMIKYYIAIINLEKGDTVTALHILKELTDKFPNKCLYQFETFDILYKNEQLESSLSHLAQAVKLSPGLLDNPYLKKILSKNIVMNEALENTLLQDTLKWKLANDPVLLAKGGKLLLSLGYEHDAKQYFEKSIQLLPNLNFPYLYLSQIETNQKNPVQRMIYLKQFMLLFSRNFNKDFINKTVHSDEFEKSFINKKSIDNSYPMKFRTWYHSSIIPNYFFEERFTQFN